MCDFLVLKETIRGRMPIVLGQIGFPSLSLLQGKKIIPQIIS